MKYAAVFIALLRLTGHAEAQTDFRSEAHGTPRNLRGQDEFQVLLASADTPLSPLDCQAAGGMVMLTEATSTVCISGGICAINSTASRQSRMCVTTN